MMQRQYPGWEGKDRGWHNSRHNLQQIKGVLPQGCRIIAVVKADAYGHGAVRIASELQKMGVKDFAVATLQEGIQLRNNGIRGDILILGYTHPDCIPKLRRYRLTQTIGRISMDQLTVDITGIPDVGLDDVATVIGPDGEKRISVEQVARQCGTISNEVLSRLGRRLDKVYSTSTL